MRAGLQAPGGSLFERRPNNGRSNLNSFPPAVKNPGDE